MYKLCISFIILVLVISSTCQATIIEGTFSGTIKSYYDEANEGRFDNVLRYWDESFARGNLFSASFTYNVALAPDEYIYPPGDFSVYGSNTNNWLDIVYQINGKTIDVSSAWPESFADKISHARESVLVADSTPDKIGLYDSNDQYYRKKLDGKTIESKTVEVRTNIRLGSIMDDFLTDTSLLQSFDLSNPDGSPLGNASFSLLNTHHIKDEGWQYYQYASAYMNIDTFSMSISKVPEPSAFLLMFIALCLLLRVRSLSRKIDK